MKSLRKNERGSALIIELVVLVVVVVAAMYAYYNYEKNKSDVGSGAKPIPHAASKPSDEFDVPELGFKMVLPTGLRGLTDSFQLNQAGSTSSGSPDAISTALFSTTTLGSDDPANCSASSSPLGAISVLSFNPVGTTDYASSSNTIHLGSRWLVYQSPQEPCSANDSVSKLETSLLPLIRQAFETSTAIPVAYTASDAEALVEELWGGYYTNKLSRAVVLASSDDSVQAYIDAGGGSDPIICAQNNPPSTLTYGQPVVSGNTATILVTEDPGLRLNVSVSLSSLLISKISCLPYSPRAN